MPSSRRGAAPRRADRAYIRHQLEVYEDLGQQLYDAGRYLDVAYVDGFCVGLQVPIVDDHAERFPYDLDGFPLYYVLGHEEHISSYDEYLRIKAKAAELDPKAHAYAARIVAQLQPGVVLRHSCFLTTDPREAQFPRMR